MTRDLFGVTNEKEVAGAEITAALDPIFPLVELETVLEAEFCLKSGCFLITPQMLCPSQRKLCLVGVVRT